MNKATILSAVALSGLFLSVSAQAQVFTISDPSFAGAGLGTGLVENIYTNVGLADDGGPLPAPFNAPSPTTFANLNAYVATATPTLSYNNTVTSFLYSNNSTIGSYLGADAPALTASNSAVLGSAVNGGGAGTEFGTIFDATGYIDVTTPGAYTFDLSEADDGGQLIIGGTAIYQTSNFNQGDDFATVNFTTAGLYSVDVMTFQGSGGAGFNLFGQDPTGAAVAFQPYSAPEPSTWALMLGGVFALVVMSRRRALRV